MNVDYIFAAADTGLLHRWGYSGPEDALEANTPAGYVAIRHGAELPDPLRYRWDGAALVEYQPPKPADTADVLYVWDPDAWRWVETPSLAVRQAQVCAQLEAERDRRRFLPVVLDGVRYQADEESQALIAGALGRLLRGAGLPDPWIGWRDADNGMQWAALDAAAVRDRLSALSTALEDRESALRIATWQHKAAVRALADIAAVDQFDVTAGWP